MEKNEWVKKIRCVKGSALGRYGERHGGNTNLLDVLQESNKDRRMVIGIVGR